MPVHPDPDKETILLRYPEDGSVKAVSNLIQDNKGNQEIVTTDPTTKNQPAFYQKRDSLFIAEFRPQMIGLGPYIPQNDTPFAGQPAGSIRTTLMLLAIFRLMFPDALIPSTTALATLAPDGREQGILAGANVVMPNLSPPANRAKYALYNDKKATGLESAEGLRGLEAQLNAIGYRISYERGDYKPSDTQ